MERYSFECKDRVFFERYTELSDKQIRFYLGIRKSIEMMINPDFAESNQKVIAEHGGVIGIDDVDAVMNMELLCDKGMILRTRLSPPEL